MFELEFECEFLVGRDIKYYFKYYDIVKKQGVMK